MRVTNNMIMKNSIRNINRTKEQTSKLNDQMTSQKKITKASEDPVIAIRSLRLRDQQSQITQYLENNINDAETWMENTEEALENIKSALNDIYANLDDAVNGTNTLENKKTILDALIQLRGEVYEEANADLNGRTLFTGYKTNSTLTFLEESTDSYENIAESFSYTDMSEHDYYTASSDVPTMTTLSGGTYNESTAVTYAEKYTYNRLRLSYGDIETGSASGLTISYGSTSNTYSVTSSVTINGTATDLTLDSFQEYLASGGTVGANQVYVLHDTGELVLGSDIAEELFNNKGKASLTYDKTGFDRDEIRPELYFSCTNATTGVTYTKETQSIEYTISSNTTLVVNKEGSDFLTANPYRDISDYIDAMDAAIAAQEKVNQIQSLMDSSTYAGDEDVQAYLANLMKAAQSELDYAEDNVDNLFSKGLTAFQGYISDLASAISDVGNKGDQLDLVKSRMSSQKSTVKELISDNEDLELSEIVIEYTAAYNAYEAALLAASKASDNTLLDYL